MNDLRSKVELLRLDPIAYKARRQQVLRRDGWRSQSCGVKPGGPQRISQPLWRRFGAELDYPLLGMSFVRSRTSGIARVRRLPH